LINDETIEFARKLAKEEGILAGISCGAATKLTMRLAKKPECRQNYLVILPDSAECYLISALFEGVFDEKELALTD